MMSVTNPTSAPEAALECEPGVMRLFGLADIRTQGLASGYAYPEYGHNWNEGVDPTLVLGAKGDIGAAALIVEGEPFVTRSQPSQEMTVYLNGHRAAFWRLSRRAEYSLRINIEQEWWFPRNGWSVLKVVFHLPNSVRPVDIGEGEDGREMGFCFRSLLLEQR